ncbi:MAG: type III-B CRISPR module-associated protein Cmr5 [Verrucomicrobia bacterium]|nr:type III-B CRISPR module-associated protein Cmr5 [Verrucomicrobiota bacterium]
MKNLEQIRAKAAIDSVKKEPDMSRSAVNKLPAMIISNGLLATAAFCNAEGGGENREDMKKALDATARYLAFRGILAKGTDSVEGMINCLSERDSHELQHATAEALAFIAYLKRFAKKDDQS